MKLLADRGGINRKDAIYSIYASILSSNTNAVTVNGSGWLFFICLMPNYTGSSSTSADVIVDGVTHTSVVFTKGNESSAGNNRAAGMIYNIPMRFETSLVINFVGTASSIITSVVGLDNGKSDIYKFDSLPDPYKLLPTYGTANFNYQTTTYFDVLNISGSGYLLNIGGFTGDDDGAVVYVRIYIDGALFAGDLIVMTTTDNTSSELHLSVPIRFKSSLRIQTHSSGATAGASLITKYTLD